MNDQPAATPVSQPSRRSRSVPRLAAACGVALTLAGTAVVAQRPQAGPVLTDKQRKSLAELAEPWPDAATLAKRKADADNRVLFQSSEPIEFTLKADFKALQRDRDPESPTLHPATLIAPGTDGQPVTLQVQVRNRGRLRLHPRTCDFPPLRIEFGKDDKSELKRSLFDGIKHIKLATHCQSGFDQYVLREYLAYRTYNVITPWSLRVRRAKAAYVDLASGKTVTQPAFFIERDEDLAKRMEARVAEIPRSAFPDHDMDALTQASLFSFLIGNTDFSIFKLHNALLVRPQDGKLHTVVYDFDLAGLVSPPYAWPDKNLGLRSVKERLYRGPCRPIEELEPLLASYRDKKEAVLRLYTECPGLDRKSKEEMTAYVAEFFDIINDKGRTKHWLIDRCNKGVW